MSLATLQLCVPARRCVARVLTARCAPAGICALAGMFDAAQGCDLVSRSLSGSAKADADALGPGRRPLAGRRWSCCVSGAIAMRVNDADLKETLEKLVEVNPGLDPGADP